MSKNLKKYSENFGELNLCVRGIQKIGTFPLLRVFCIISLMNKGSYVK